MSWKQVSDRRRCTHCNGNHWCRYSADGDAELCMQVLDDPGAIRKTNKRGEEFALYFRNSGSDASREVYTREDDPIADVDTLDAVYKALLAELVLSVEHSENLMSRGLSEEWIARAGYKTISGRVRQSTLEQLVRRFGVATLKTVPGFIEESTGMFFNSPNGILVPARDSQKRIIGLKVRRDEALRSADRYRWITSRSDDYPGPSPGSPCHVPLWDGGHVDEIRITEGEIKADVATELSGMLTISIPGATAIRSCLRALEDLHPQSVVLAWDADKARIPEPVEGERPRKRNYVAIGLQNAALLLHSKGYNVSVEHWPISQGKGIDDMLSQRRQSAIIRYDGERAWRVIEQTLLRVGENPLPEVKRLANPAMADESSFSPDDRADEVFPEIPPDESWREDLPRRENGDVICRLSSLADILKHDGQWAGRLAFDEMSQMPLLDGLPIQEPLGMLQIQERVEKVWDMTIETSKITGAVLLVASDNKFHPVRRYLSGLRWDGVPRVERIVPEILRIEDPQPLDSTYVRMMLLSAVRRMLAPGTKVDTTFVLQGPQGAKKSTFFRELGSPWFSDTHMNIEDRDGKMQLASSWIYEWGEIEKITTLKHGALVKSFLSSSEDTVRLPYARTVTKMPRHTIIVGTTNEDEFLTDSTGDRRYWVVRVRRQINAELLREWRDQIWAEAMAIAAEGERVEPHYLNADQEKSRAGANEQFRTADLWMDIVVRWLASQVKLCGCYQLEEVFLHALGMEPKEVTRGDERRMGAILRELGFERSSSKITFFRDRKRFWARAWLTPKAGPWVNADYPTDIAPLNDSYTPVPTSLANKTNQRGW